MPITVRQDRELIRSTYRSNRFVLAELTAPHAHREHRAKPAARQPRLRPRPLRLDGRREDQPRQAGRRAVDRRVSMSDDRFSVVVYDDHDRRRLPVHPRHRRGAPPPALPVSTNRPRGIDQPGRGLAARLPSRSPEHLRPRASTAACC